MDMETIARNWGNRSTACEPCTHTPALIDSEGKNTKPPLNMHTRSDIPTQRRLIQTEYASDRWRVSVCVKILVNGHVCLFLLGRTYMAVTGRKQKERDCKLKHTEDQNHTIAHTSHHRPSFPFPLPNCKYEQTQTSTPQQFTHSHMSSHTHACARCALEYALFVHASNHNYHTTTSGCHMNLLFRSSSVDSYTSDFVDLTAPHGDCGASSLFYGLLLHTVLWNTHTLTYTSYNLRYH